MTRSDFVALCEANSFGAAARDEVPMIPSGMLKALVDAAEKQAFERCISICKRRSSFHDSDTWTRDHSLTAKHEADTIGMEIKRAMAVDPEAKPA